MHTTVCGTCLTLWRPAAFGDWLKQIGQPSRLHLKKNVLVGGCGFFVTDVISEVVLGSFWLMLPGLGPNY